MHPNPCTLSAEAHGHVLDRLAGLRQLIPTSLLQQVLRDTDRVNCRACVLTYEVTLWVVLAMGLLTDLPIRQVFKHARRLRPGEKTPRRSSLCEARKRLGIAPVRRTFEQVVRPLATPQTPGAFYRRWRLMGIDSTVLDLPDSPANAATFGRPGGGPRGQGAYPQLRKLSLVELGTHAELGVVLRPHRTGESTMVPGLLRHLRSDMLVVWDRGFFSYELWKTLIGRGVQVLARVKAGLILRPIQGLADGSYLAKIYPGGYARDKDREGLVVRVIRYRLDDLQRVGHDEEHVLITTLLDAETDPALDLIALYHQRWEHELVYDEQKTHQDPRRATKPAQLRSETPCGVIQEVYALSLGHFVVRALMVEAARPLGLDGDRLSFLGCLQILRCRLPECDSRTPETMASWYAGLLWELGQERTDLRRERVNPRVVKRKMSKFKKKRPEHSRQPPLKKRFIETVVMVR